MIDDLFVAARNLLRRPLYPMVAVAILAIGLSVGTAVFTYFNGFYQPFPGVDAERLMQVFTTGEEQAFDEVSYPDFLDLAARESTAFAGVTADQTGFGASVRHEHMTEVIFGQAVAGNYFTMMDARMHLGRGLSVDDDRAEAPPVTVISYSYWQRRFQSDPEVVGRTIFLNNKAYTMVGVADRRLLGSSASFRPDIWLPMEAFKVVYWARDDRETNRELEVMRPFVRLNAGASSEQAQAELDAFSASLDATYPLESGPRNLQLTPATWIHPGARASEHATLRLMLGSAAVLLLLTCANVANLLLSIASGRGREMALRAALGASPSRLLRQVLVETALLSSLAGAVALVLAGPASARLGSFFARPSVWGSYVAREVAIDGRVFAFALGIAMVTGLVAGLLPAFRGARGNLVARLRQGERTSTGVSGIRLPGIRRLGARDVLVASQVALAVVLLIVAGLMVRTLDAVGGIDPGFDAEHLVASIMTTSSTEIPPERRQLFYRQLTERLAQTGWVRAAAVADRAPLAWHPTVELRLEGHDQPVDLAAAKVDPAYFDTLGIAIVDGRRPTWEDAVEGVATFEETPSTPGVVVVNETLVRRYFPEINPLGRKLWWPGKDGAPDRVFEIVGVSRDAKLSDLFADDEPTVYFAYPQHYYKPGNALLLSTTIDPAAALPLLEKELREINPRLALLNALPYGEVVRGFTYSQRMNAELFSTISGLGLALAAVGIFSVLSLAVSRRRREIGIRKALGATSSAIVKTVTGRLLAVVVLGMAVGLGTAFAALRTIKSQLYGVEPGDPIVFVFGLASLLAAGVIASYVPVRRAVRADPLASLRCE